MGAHARIGTPGRPLRDRSPSTLLRRACRCLTLRPETLSFDDHTAIALQEAIRVHDGLRFVAKSPDDRTRTAYDEKLSGLRRFGIPVDEEVVFLEVVTDADTVSESASAGLTEEHGHRVLRVHGRAVPTAMAAALLAVAQRWNVRPEIHLDWSERNPLSSAFDYMTSGQGDVGPVLREVLRRAEPRCSARPRVHLA
jgi:hypothetical protein